MAKLKKMKKWGTRSRRHAERAETAADRAEAALRRIAELTGGDTGGTVAPAPREPTHHPAYTRPRAEDAVP